MAVFQDVRKGKESSNCTRTITAANQQRIPERTHKRSSPQNELIIVKAHKLLHFAYDR